MVSRLRNTRQRHLALQIGRPAADILGTHGFWLVFEADSDIYAVREDDVAFHPSVEL
jgi:hypothetical protein